MKLHSWLTLLPLLAALTLPAQAQQTHDIRQDMRIAGDTLAALVPYIYHDGRFRAEENQSFIALHLERLIDSMQQRPDLLQQHAVVRQISQTTLVDQIKQARHLFNTGNYATAQYLLGSVPLLCSSCHIQDGVIATGQNTVPRTLFANDFSYAEFNYYLRNYPVAEAAYLEYLKRHDVRTSRISGGKTLERLLDITLISGQNFDAARQKLQQYRDTDDLDRDLLQRLDQWQAGIDQLQQRAATYKPLEIQIYEVFGASFNLKHTFIQDESTRPMALAWRAQLQKNIMKTDDRTEVARHLYLIAILERILGDQDELSLANLYLKECVKLAVDDFSHRCLNEYESYLYFYYGGSSDSEPPAEVQQELKRLRQQARRRS